MRLANLDSNTWLRNHPGEHHARFYRYVYPFHLLQRVDFDPDHQGQAVQVYGHRLTLESARLQENGRYIARVLVESVAPRDPKGYAGHRVWNARFDVVYALDGYFITVFTANKHAVSKDLKRLMGADGPPRWFDDVSDPAILRAAIDGRTDDELVPYRSDSDGTYRFASDLYRFKRQLAECLSGHVARKSPFVRVALSGEYTLVEIDGLLFSYQGVRKASALRRHFEGRNAPDMQWDGFPLQPLSPLLLAHGRVLVASHSD